MHFNNIIGHAVYGIDTTRAEKGAVITRSDTVLVAYTMDEKARKVGSPRTCHCSLTLASSELASSSSSNFWGVEEVAKADPNLGPLRGLPFVKCFFFTAFIFAVVGVIILSVGDDTIAWFSF